MSVESILSNLELNKPVKSDATGYWFITGVAAREGVQEYPEYGFSAYRDAAFIKEMTELLKFVPVTLQHFEQSPTQNRDKKVGLIVDTTFKDGLALVRICVDDPYLCALFESGEASNKHLGLSVGYSSPMKNKLGSWRDVAGIAGQKNKQYPFQKQQVAPITVNHLAFCELGRGGEVVKAITDEAPSTENFTFSDTFPLQIGDTKKKKLSDEEIEIEINTTPETATAENENEESSESSVEEDATALFPYPENHSSARRKQTDMAEDSSAMMDKMSAVCDKMNKMCDGLSAMADKYGATCDSMTKVADNLSASIDFISAIKEAFESPDRPYDLLTKTPSKEAVADSAAFSAQVADAVGLWLEFSDSLKEQVTDFGQTASQLKRVLLKDSEVFEISDSTSDAEVNAAFSVFRNVQNQVKATKTARSSQVQDVFKKFKDTSSESLSVEDGAGFTRQANGGLVFK
jgi:Uncharacterized protein conserved in bacteria (DUF2213)